MPNKELKPCPFSIGDIVYVLGKYLPDSNAPLLLMECKISYIKHRQFVAYRTDGETGDFVYCKSGWIRNHGSNQGQEKCGGHAEKCWCSVTEARIVRMVSGRQ